MAYNENVIEDVELEQKDSAGYYKECCEFLEDFITKRPKIAATEVQAALSSLLEVLRSNPEDRDLSSVEELDQLVRPFLFDHGCLSQPGASLAAALLLLGMAGKALYFLSKQTQNPQFETEIGRLFKDLNEVRSNIWLFHVSAQMIRCGFEIRFITEGEQQTLTFLRFEEKRRSMLRRILATQLLAALMESKMHCGMYYMAMQSPAESRSSLATLPMILV